MGFDSGIGFAGGGGSGGGGSVTLTYTQIAFGSASNTVTSSANLTYDIATTTFSLGFSNPIIYANESSGIVAKVGDVNDAINGTNIAVNDSTQTTTINTFFASIGAADNFGTNLEASYVLGTVTLPDLDPISGSFTKLTDSSNNVAVAGVTFDSLLYNGVPAAMLGTFDEDGTAYSLFTASNNGGHTYLSFIQTVDTSGLSGTFSLSSSDCTISFGNNATNININDSSMSVSMSNAWATPSMTVYTNGTVTPNVTIGNGVRGLYYNPASLVSAATITLPPAPIDGQEVLIIFGGTITSGTVVTALTIAPNTGQTALIYAGIGSSGIVGLEIKCRYLAATSQWFVMNSSNVASVSNSDGTLTISPTTGAVVASIALGHQNQWTAGQAGLPYGLTDASTIAVNFANGNNFSDVLTGNRTLGVPTNVQSGQSGIFAFTQDGTGSRTLAYSWCYLFSGGTTPTLSTGKYITDVLPYIVLYYSSSAAITASGTTFTWTAHGMQSGQIMQFTAGTTTTPALNTSYWVNVLSSSTFNLSTTLANLQSGTYITASGVSGNLTGSSLGILISSLLNIQQ